MIQIHYDCLEVSGRHSAREMLIMFSKPIDVKDSNEAELKTIRKALQVFKVSYSSHLVGESDSTVAVSWVG